MGRDQYRVNEQFDPGQKSYAALDYSAFSILRNCRYLRPDADNEAIVEFVVGGLSHA
jgi:hypothetical protein